MKTMIPAIILASILPVCAQETTTTEETVTRNPDGSTTTTTVETTTFNPEARTKVVKYFDTYREERYGLPPEWASRVQAREMPATWRTSISPGVVVTETQRPYLIDAPPELTGVLPRPSAGVRYYVAGSNVVAVDRDYRVVDAIQIPSIKIVVE